MSDYEENKPSDIHAPVEENDEVSQEKSGLSQGDEDDLYEGKVKRMKLMEEEEELFSDEFDSFSDDDSISSAGIDFNIIKGLSSEIKDNFEQYINDEKEKGLSYKDIMKNIGFYYLSAMLDEEELEHIFDYVIEYIKRCKKIINDREKEGDEINHEKSDVSQEDEHEKSEVSQEDELSKESQSDNISENVEKKDTEPTDGSKVIEPTDIEKKDPLSNSKEEISQLSDHLHMVEPENKSDNNNLPVTSPTHSSSDDDSDSESELTFPPNMDDLIESHDDLISTDPTIIISYLSHQLKFQIELSKTRKKLAHINTIEDVVQCIRDANNVIVLSGAGISVSCGIPDFRSPGGLYDQVREKYNLSDPQFLFDIRYFRYNPNPFYDFAQQLFADRKLKPSKSHMFIKLLEMKNKLLRNYSQNIDTLEKLSGISDDKVVLCHGSFSTFSCIQCGNKEDGSLYREEIKNKTIPICKKCHSDVGQNIVKPDIVFFGESLPDTFRTTILSDIKHCDLLVVIGSSLQVQPVALIPSLISEVSSKIPQILINKEHVSIYHEFDYHFKGNCDDAIENICELIGWKDELESLLNSTETTT